MIGSVVGNYKIIDKIGEGGMGAVFKGVDLMLEREVAIKMLRPELARQPNVVERFRTEAVTLAKLNHTNVATLHSFFRQGEDFFMVMEFVSGQTLGDMIKAQGALEANHAVELFCMALEGIDHAHKMGIVHRDIKPANMMLTETGSIKVMDFGIARVLGTDRMTKAGHLIGTVEYMSPEQIRGEDTDARSDIYSLGILLYEMLTGRVPFNSTSEYELMRCQIEDPPTPPRVLAPHIPLAVEQAIMCALAKKPEARYQSASEFRTMLIQKTTGSVTKVDTSPASFVTRESESIVSAPSSGQVIKETRLASDPGVPVALGGQLKETRLAPTVGLPGGYQETSPQYFAAQPQAGGSLASLLGKLNWKHYSAAALVLVALISLPLALISGGDKSSTTQPPADGQPSPTAPATAPAQSVVPNTNQPIPQAGAASVPVQADDQGGATKSTRSHSAGSQTGTQGQSRTPAQTRSSAGTKGDGTTTTTRNERDNANKSKVAKVGEKAQAVGGAIKKRIGGIFRKKNP
ncbi:MAG: protein kinase [Acidobacteriota bacterium]